MKKKMTFIYFKSNNKPKNNKKKKEKKNGSNKKAEAGFCSEKDSNFMERKWKQDHFLKYKENLALRKWFL